MKGMFLTLVALAALTAGAAAWQAKAANVAGNWEMTVKGPAAHGDLTAVMQLEQDNKKVTGSFTAHGNTHTVAGEFSEGELKLETTDTPADRGMSLRARLRDDGTLAGYLSSGMGDMQWTASRQARK